MKTQTYIKIIRVATIVTSIVVIGGLGYLTGKVIQEVQTNGLKSIIDEIWYGPTHPTQYPTSDKKETK